MRFWTQCQSDSFWSCSLCFYCNMSLCDGLQLPKLVEVRVSPLEVVVCTFGFNLKNYGHSCPQDVFWVSKKKKHNFIVFFKKRGHTSFETYLRYIPYRFQRVQWILSDGTIFASMKLCPPIRQTTPKSGRSTKTDIE